MEHFVFSADMSRNRFREIRRFLRFDLRSTRSVRLRTDKFALISEVWNAFISNSRACYKSGVNITVDEQLQRKLVADLLSILQASQTYSESIFGWRQMLRQITL